MVASKLLNEVKFFAVVLLINNSFLFSGLILNVNPLNSTICAITFFNKESVKKSQKKSFENSWRFILLKLHKKIPTITDWDLILIFIVIYFTSSKSASCTFSPALPCVCSGCGCASWVALYNSSEAAIQAASNASNLGLIASASLVS